MTSPGQVQILVDEIPSYPFRGSVGCLPNYPSLAMRNVEYSPSFYIQGTNTWRFTKCPIRLLNPVAPVFLGLWKTVRAAFNGAFWTSGPEIGTPNPRANLFQIDLADRGHGRAGKPRGSKGDFEFTHWRVLWGGSVNLCNIFTAVGTCLVLFLFCSFLVGCKRQSALLPRVSKTWE